MTDENYTIGDELDNGKKQVAKSFAFLASVLVYVAGIVYAEVHGLNLMINGVKPDMVLWAVLGIVSLGITALTLPVALHFWFHAPDQKWFGYAFYAVDLALLFFNAIADFSLNTGNVAALPSWIVTYMTLVIPANPVIIALGWSIVWILDPASKEMDAIFAYRTALRTAFRKKIAVKAKDMEIDDIVDKAAYNFVYSETQRLLGTGASPRPKQQALPPPQEVSAWHQTEEDYDDNDLEHEDTLFSDNGRKASLKRMWDTIRPNSVSGSGNGHSNEEEITVVVDTVTGEAKVNGPNPTNKSTTKPK